MKEKAYPTPNFGPKACSTNSSHARVGLSGGVVKNFSTDGKTATHSTGQGAPGDRMRQAGAGGKLATEHADTCHAS